MLGLVTGLLGGVAGCSGSPSRNTSTLTPAPVGTAGERASVEAPAADRCPELPSNAEVYICASADGEGLTLSAVSTRADPPVVELRNETTVPFDTGTDWWTLSRQRSTSEGRRDATDRWQLTEQGAGTDDRRVEPGGRLRWQLGGADMSSTGRPPDRVDVSLAAGRYAFSIVGYVPAGELTALVLPFEVQAD